MGRRKTKWVRMRWKSLIETTRKAVLAPTFRLGLEASGRDKKSGKKTRLFFAVGDQPGAAGRRTTGNGGLALRLRARWHGVGLQGTMSGGDVGPCWQKLIEGP